MGKFRFFTDKPLEKYRKSDSSIALLMILMWGLGMVTLYFCSSDSGFLKFNDSLHFMKRQLISSALGFVLFCVFLSLNMETVRKILPILVFGSLFLCLLTLVPGIGVERNGARRWIRIPFLFFFQPSEAIKFVSILFLANYFDKQSRIQKKEDRNVFPAVALLIIFSGSILMQQDFSTSVFVFMIGIVLFVVSGQKIIWLFPLMTIIGPLCALMVFLEPYRLSRIIGFFSPEEYQETINYQSIAARKAISSGGFWGQGFGSGLTKISNIPEIQSDYIFAGWVEALGLFGVLAYFALLGLFSWRVLHCALTTADRFASIAVFGFLAAIIGQSLMNVAVVAGVLPTTGVPLPFFSSGGSSIIITFAMCGFILSASRIDNIEDRKLSLGGVIYE